MPASGYYDEITHVEDHAVGAWQLEVGRLPDMRYAVDHYSRADGRKQRLYFNTYVEAHNYATTFGRLPAREEN